MYTCDLYHGMIKIEDSTLNRIGRVPLYWDEDIATLAMTVGLKMWSKVPV